jgi:hypothetical protein
MSGADLFFGGADRGRTKAVGSPECGGRFMSPLRGLPILPHGRRGLAPTAKLYRRYAAGLTRCVEQRPCGPGLMNHAASRLRRPSGGKGCGFSAYDLLGGCLRAALEVLDEGWRHV